jgi:Protein of unknown function (DUF3999)
LAVTVLLLAGDAAVSAATVSVPFDSRGWNRFRDVTIPDQVPDGLVGIALESNVVEQCRSDLEDVRVVSSRGNVVPAMVTGIVGDSDSQTFPVRTFKVSTRAGQWTDIWIDKTSKTLARGVSIKTSSQGFVRKVEVRGSDNNRESYVIRMDGLIADIASPVPLRTLNIFFPNNNFQYIFLRILDQGKPPLKVEGVLCYAPSASNSVCRELTPRVVENRANPSAGSTLLVADLGENRFPLTRLSISTPAREFIQKATVLAAPSLNSESWKPVSEGVLFRLRREDAVKEKLTVRVKPLPFRYIRLQLSGGTGGPISVDSLQAWGGFRMAVFEHHRGETYRLYYGNPGARAPGTATRFSMNVNRLAAASSEVTLGAERKIVVGPSAAGKPDKREKKGTLGIWSAVGLGLVLAGLLFLFLIMLRIRSSRRAYRGRNSRVVRGRL